MNKLLVVPAILFTVSACQSTDVTQATDATQATANKNIQYLDLSDHSQKSLLDRYWQVKFRKEPKYPRAAALQGISGCAELVVGIDADGKVSHFKVIKSYPPGVFDKNAAEAALGWRYAPTATNQDLQPVLTTLQLDFTVQNSKNVHEATAKCTRINTAAVEARN